MSMRSPYLGVYAGFTSLVLLVGATLIQFVPEGLGLPGIHLGLELRVEVSMV